MIIGKLFHKAWQAADEGARQAAAAIATGAKVIGQIPVAMAHAENALLNAGEKAAESTIKAGVQGAKNLAVTASEWKTWMDVKTQEVLAAAHRPADPNAAKQRGDEATERLK